MNTRDITKWIFDNPVSKKSFELFCKGVFDYYCPVKTYGLENLPSHPFILCSNHHSHIDTAVLMYASGLPQAQFAALAAKDYFFSASPRGQIIRSLLNIVPVSRSSDSKALLNMVKLCKHHVKDRNRALIIYPSGGRCLPGEVKGFKNGAVFLAKHLKLPILPVHIQGADKALPKGKKLLKPTRIIVNFGQPIDVSSQLKTLDSTMKKTQQYDFIARLLKENIMALEEKCLEQAS